jgi:hypothetical protein
MNVIEITDINCVILYAVLKKMKTENTSRVSNAGSGVPSYYDPVSMDRG